MSALILQNNALWHIFENFTPSILLSACFLIYVIRNQFSKHPPTHDNKIANELSARMSEINGILTAEIEKNKARDGGITAEIERILNDVYKNLSAEVNTKIANEVSARLSEVNSTFTAELVRNNNELNKKLTGEITKINSRDAGYASEAQKIFSRLNNIEETRQSDYGRIRSLEKSVIDRYMSIEAYIRELHNKINQYYAEVRGPDFDSVSEASTRSRESGNSTSSSSSSSNSPLEENRNRFKRISNESEALNWSRNSTPSSSSSNSSLDENRNRFKRVFIMVKGVQNTT